MADNVGSKVSFFLVGLGIGALVGILFAPKSGEETREYLSSKAEEGRDYAQKKARELRERAEDLIERSKEIMARQKEGLSAAVESGKEAYKREAKLSWCFARKPRSRYTRERACRAGWNYLSR
jgi:gas vesicle protein